MISTLLTFLVVGIVAVAVLGVVLSVFGLALGLLIKLVPLILIGWVVMKVIGGKKHKELSAEDRKWLES
jgi:hypothetical protein